MRLRVGAATDTGRVRELNEDVYASRADRGLFVVCDGMGGAPAGEVASQLALDAILEQLEIDRDGGAPADAGYQPHTNRLAAAVRRSNQVIYDQAQRNVRQAEMGTTVVGAWIAEHIASVAHVGDSRAYLWRDQRLEPLTRDHSLAEALLQAGLLDPNDSQQAEEQNVLIRVLGREPDVEVDVTEVPVQPGDYLLLCSDGLTRMVADPIVADAIVKLREPQRICDALVDAANRNGGTDNITVVVVEVARGPWQELSTWLKRQARRLLEEARRELNAQTHPAV